MAFHSYYDITPLLEKIDRAMPVRRLPREDSLVRSRPATFAAFHDPENRYELHYPAEWCLQAGHAPTVSSPKIGLFARIDLLPPEGEVWERLLERMPRLSIRTRRAERAEGTIALSQRVLAWTGYAYALRAVRVILSTGLVEDDAPASIRAYRRGILASIRRQFRLGPGLRSD